MTKKNKAPVQIDTNQRHCLIAETAYLIAEQRGFQNEDSLADWLQAEACIDTKFVENEKVPD